MESEIWKEIPTLNNYSISSLNRVRRYNPRTTEYYILQGCDKYKDGVRNYLIQRKVYSLPKLVCMDHHPEKSTGRITFLTGNKTNLSPNNVQWNISTRERARLKRIAKARKVLNDIK
jgi:hypothetical protein